MPGSYPTCGFVPDLSRLLCRLGQVLEEPQRDWCRDGPAALPVLYIDGERDVTLVADEPGVRLRRAPRPVLGGSRLRHHRASRRLRENNSGADGDDLTHEGTHVRDDTGRQRRAGGGWARR